VGFPKGKYAIFAQFGMAVCYEELEQLDEAFRIYERIKDQYPEKGVLEIKLKRVAERRSRRSR
jgi:TolA-binding protein